MSILSSLIKFNLVVLMGLSIGLHCSAETALPKGISEGSEIAYARVLQDVNSDAGLLSINSENKISVAHGHRSYSVGLDSILGGRLLSDAKFQGYRYLVMADAEVVGEVTVDFSEDTKGTATIIKGPFASATLVALNKAMEIPQINASESELRFVVASAIPFVAIWLHRDKEDFLIPLRSSSTGGPKAYDVISEESAIKVLRPRAAKVAEAEKNWRP